MRRIIFLLCSAFFSMNLAAQTTTTVSFVVTSKDGSALPASVTIKGTTRGTSTDAQGNYSLTQVPSNAVLVFSSVSFQTFETPVSGRTTITVSLEYDAQSLD